MNTHTAAIANDVARIRKPEGHALKLSSSNISMQPRSPPTRAPSTASSATRAELTRLHAKINAEAIAIAGADYAASGGSLVHTFSKVCISLQSVHLAE